LSSARRASVSNSWFSPQRSGGEIRSSLLNCRVPPGAKRRGEQTGNQTVTGENKHQPAALGETGLLDPNVMVVMKTNNWVKLILIAGITLSVTAVSIAEEWGTVMYARPNTLIREKRSMNSRIKGHLGEKQAVKADFLKDGWYAVFSLMEKDRNESKALGYVYKTRLYVDTHKSVAATPDSEKKWENGSTVSNKNLNIDVKNISFKLKNNGNESIFIEFNRFYTPAISSVEGKEPRIVLDIENVSSFKKEWSVIKVEGKLIKQIRSSMDYKARKARIVLDLEPSKDYFVQPVFGEREHIYSLQISADDKKQEPQ